ncbi:DUF2164 domain-containing protein [Virgibacillus sp. NKC19-3]|uniref:DUF2164 domain-containing protein n=1 Tax=Virgibacillus saliphilus TaxID=2831674 RepID=UPI001C9A94EA|nr:DUF2164 domain-containing protein [Virgibacillus sp. NKC19-3]MBY7144184.1 DUF2164 domain-containing protein [Virgibacillus sp. NKC19-3]
MKPKIELTKPEKETLVGIIQGYFERERGEQIGELAAMLMLDFFIEEIAPLFYNKGVEDSRSYMTEKLDDLYEILKD